MARKGSIPRPLLELIVENNTWIQAPIVRRAILGNPRVSTEAIMKLLRMTPKHELRPSTRPRPTRRKCVRPRARCSSSKAPPRARIGLGRGEVDALGEGLASGDLTR